MRDAIFDSSDVTKKTDMMTLLSLLFNLLLNVNDDITDACGHTDTLTYVSTYTYRVRTYFRFVYIS